ncbi:MAG TPA: DUF4920 domain-containing protein [Chitinophagaceae bacterium]|jgi:hypothetical protein|nr:DUF4920 domain-containing protein [Chitinophagaceae bacterium]
MKHIFTFAIAALLFTSCNENAETKTTTKTEAGQPKIEFFGEKITEEGAKPTDSLKSMMGANTELACKLEGKIQAVCQTKGCWMELKNNDGTSMRVTFKDYGFFMPKDASGKTAIVDGIAKIEETSIADLKEYAKDDKKSKEEIEAITEPLKELVFEAKGVILK